ncbi:MAG: alpha/beta hydrolase [Chloroflexia bacterium]|nr:alpha/beta hydrolase [Chloroflexia bacterium]
MTTTGAEHRAFFHDDEDNVVGLDEFAAEHVSPLVPYLRQLHPNGEDQWRNVVRLSANIWLTYEGLSPEEMARIVAPTLVVVADHDEFHPLEEVVRLYRRLPNAEPAILPGGDHMRPIFGPDLLAPVLIDFLDRH